ncbi:MAG: hypothetical protein J07HB67_00069 [halophilic archaeon J07HB67]|nr:MAG: hypothetical protein J07HB67_00069 [halophilic archaeon J07HB67]
MVSTYSSLGTPTSCRRPTGRSSSVPTVFACRTSSIASAVTAVTINRSSVDTGSPSTSADRTGSQAPTSASCRDSGMRVSRIRSTAAS